MNAEITAPRREKLLAALAEKEAVLRRSEFSAPKRFFTMVIKTRYAGLVAPWEGPSWEFHENP